MQTCVGCGKGAPETNTNYTLISAQFGWRLTRTKQSDGAVRLEWRCPNCWRDFKRTRSPLGSADAVGERAHEMPPPAADTEPPPRTRTSRAPSPSAGPRRGRP